MRASSAGQRGAVLILLLAILVLGGMWFMVTRVASLRQDFIASDRERNAAVLNRAKRALIGYVVQEAAQKFEDDPGALPCPEAPGSFNSSTGQDGQTASSCTLPAVGRFPWRSIGSERFVDTAGEPLWYVVSPGWAHNGANTDINSNSTGQLVVDGVSGTDGDTVVALIIAPGPALQVQASSGCTAWNQTRSTAPPPDLRNYLECQNATSPADTTFVTSGPSGSFNDQVVRVTKADVMPGIEAAIADRIAREIAPALKAVYAAPNWGFTGSNYLYAYPVPFSDPGTASYQGSSATPYRGLLPFTYSSGCDPTTDARCSTSFVVWDTGFTPQIQRTGTNDIDNPNCFLTGNTTAQCTGQYKDNGTLQVRMTVRARNVAMALRTLDVTQATAQYQLFGTWLNTGVSVTASGSLDSNGRGLVNLNASLPFNFGGTNVRFIMPIGVLADHALLNKNDATTGWFVRNEWYRLTYYAVAQGYTANVLSGTPSCSTGSTCLSVANVTPTGAQRAILILAGRSINGTTRSSGTLANYLEFGNATGSYERQLVSTANASGVKKPFNDRIIVLDSN